MKKEKTHYYRTLSLVITIGGLIGLLSSFILSVDTFKSLQNPTFNPNCNLNPILSCGSVMKSDQAQVFGFPNPLMGIAEYGFLTTLGLLMLGGAKLNKRFWLAIEASVLGSILFIHWLLFESLYRIGTVCPYCLLTWLATIAIFVYTTLHIFKLAQTKNRFLLFLQKHPIDIIVLWYVIIFGLMLVKFWYYWSSLI